MSADKGKVSVWVNKVPPSKIPRSYFEEHHDRGDEEPLCQWAGSFGFAYYDHDFLEVARRTGKPIPIRDLLKNVSHARSFAEQLGRAAVKAGIDRANHLIFLYD